MDWGGVIETVWRMLSDEGGDGDRKGQTSAQGEIRFLDDSIWLR